MNNKRVIIEGVKPQIDSGRFPIKRVIGEKVEVEADIFVDGHDALSATLLYRQATKGAQWREADMSPLVNDRWAASFPVTELGFYLYTIEAWVDHFKSWRRDFQKKLEAGLDISIDLLIGADLVEQASKRATGKNCEQLVEFCQFLRAPEDSRLKTQLALDEELAQLIFKYPDKSLATKYERELSVVVERQKARFSTWYELFPRSCGEGTEHGTFADCERQLPAIAAMGFDIVYFPPIHPIGKTKRKGRNNSIEAEPGDFGSPWAIGAKEGGHKAIHPDLGSLDDFKSLVNRAKELGLEVALDLAFQCSPDHPYVEEHPEWFRQRPDGTVQYAENPPKKYEDIYPFNFECENSAELWNELKSVIEYWIDQGVSIFRVDNPHTKPFAFWEWVIAELRGKNPNLIFLSEAFTRPKIMYRLGKLGFTQSYTYFAWRNTKWELTQYFTELTQTEVREFFRPNAWPNTPDILTEYLQTGGKPAFMIRLVLAATLTASYGIYGPAYELCLAEPREPGSEEYRDSEKYEIKDYDPESVLQFRELISVINRIRRDNPALQIDHTLRFHEIDNEQLICYSKADPVSKDLVIVVVNLDPHHTHAGWVELPLDQLGIPKDRPYQVHDLIADARYLWLGHRNYVEINPHIVPAHIFKVRRKVRTEHDFEYFL